MIKILVKVEGLRKERYEVLRILESHKREPEFGLLGENREYVDMNAISIFGDVGDIMRSEGILVTSWVIT